MKKIFYLIISLVVLQGTVFGQVNESKDFLYFFTDSVVYGNVEYKTPFLDTDHFLLNSKRIALENVKFYKNQTRFFANTKNVNFWRTSTFSECIRKGKINLYEKVKVNTSPGHFTASGVYMGGTSSVTILNYYNKGFDDLKKANYTNLSLDLADNSESMKHLLKYKKVQNTETSFWVAGGAAILVGFVTLVNKTYDVDYDTEPSPNVSANLATIGIGAGCCLVSYIISFSKPEHLRKAVDVYNN